MKLLHMVESMASSGGGLPAAVKALMNLQRTAANDVDCVATSMVNSTDDVSVAGLKGGSVFRTVLNVLILCRTISGKRYEWVHIHGLWNVFFVPIFLACVLAKVRYVVTTHGQLLPTLLAADAFPKRMKKNIYYLVVGRMILRFANKIHVSSENELIEFRKDSSLRHKVHYIPHIVDDVFTSACNESKSMKSVALTKDILFVGRLDERKGILALIEGFAAAKLGPEWRLRIVGPAGDGDFMQRLTERIASTELRGRVELAAPVYGDDRLDLYRSCYLFCLPSYSEAPGLVNVEAALSGRPVLTTPCTGLFQIAQHGGVLCEPLAVAIRAALTNIALWSEEEYRERSMRIQAWARSEYALESIVPKWRAFYS